jgi:hypothetical protein
VPGLVFSPPLILKKAPALPPRLEIVWSPALICQPTGATHCSARRIVRHAARVASRRQTINRTIRQPF